MREVCCGFALILHSAVLRFMFSSFLLLVALPFPHIVTDSARAVLEWFEKTAKEIDLRISVNSRPLD